MPLLGILELKKDIGAIVHQPESILCQLTFFESIPYFSPQGPVIASEFISLSLSVPLPAPVVVHDVFSPVSLKDIVVPPAPKSPWEKISDMSTLIGKKFMPLSHFRPPPL